MSPAPTSLVRARPRTLARYGAGVVAGLASFALVGCGSEETPVPAASSAPATTSAAAPPPETSAPASASPSASASASSGADGNRQALLAAVATAQDQLSGTTVVSVEQDDESGQTVWQVGVVTRDGDEQDVDVSADGSEVVRTERVDRQDEADRRENRALVDDAEVDVTDAVEALPGSVDGGTVDQLELDRDRGSVVWEADVLDTDRREHEIRIDARSGDVLSDRT
ncbi:Peptidase propeptide and YPEB domain-containing protein [Microlunatus sagamiharensis]|uniref:Peptidase propeptide and YPEB domain-containing protein n=1 Tax=Microlunatus sagamiharensis TaxID=546874 RepID=A0A1H2MJ29_9ACTN|nr:PepSY domain-containing protein [Microlunatus sagamiharensis]SDU92931.1 Peptidase propeptide and YPEB domain-containing protein [Microlunatus sagamiharensis]